VLDVAIPLPASRTSTESATAKPARPAVQVPRRQPHRSLVAAIGLAVVAVLVAALAGGTWFL
jgi:Mce-associated membrane protein